jgi:chemotaxis protein methyltransferase CheR
MEDSQFRRILDRFGFSWAGYRKVRKGVKKRLIRHMKETGFRRIDDYTEAMERDREMRVRFECLLTVPISRFFRDRELWRSVREKILPVLARAPHVVKVWSAGCASGEEVYTLKILWEDMKKNCVPLPCLRLLATDLCPKYLERAKAAVYSESSMKEVPDTIRSAYFEMIAEDKYAVAPRIKDGILWQVHDLLSDPPGTAFDLILLRNNLLTYYKNEVRIPALTKAVDTLTPGGFLLIGIHERMPLETADLKHLEGAGHIFQKDQKI